MDRTKLFALSKCFLAIRDKFGPYEQALEKCDVAKTQNLVWNTVKTLTSFPDGIAYILFYIAKFNKSSITRNMELLTCTLCYLMQFIHVGQNCVISSGVKALVE